LPNEPSQWNLWAWLMIVRVRTTCPRLRPVEKGGTHVIQPPKRRGQVFGLGQGALTGGLTGAIKIKDDPLTACSIDQVPGLPLVGERTAEQIIEKERAESFDRRLGEIRQKAREG